MNFWHWLALLLIALKLIGAIDWSWLWVLAPLWAPFCLGMAIGLSAIIGGWAVIGALALKERLDLARYRRSRGY